MKQPEDGQAGEVLSSGFRGWPAREWLKSFLLVAATLLAYSPAWFGKPVWDDDAHMTRPELRSLSGLVSIWLEPGATQQYYPLTFSAFWAQHRLWGDSTPGYHLVNILLHAASALLVVRILRRLGIPGAWLAGAIFALHPVHVESVAWISELKNTLSGVFFFSAVLAYLHFDQTRRRSCYALALVLFILGLTTKTAIASFPACLLVAFWWKRGRLSWKRDVLALLPFFLAGLAAGLVTAWVEITLYGARGDEFQFSLLERCLIAGRSLWFHLSKLFWPANLAFMYTRWKIDSTVWWQYLYPIAAVLLLTGLWVLRRRNRGPLAGMFLFTGILFPALGFFNAYSFRYSFVNDHHQYLASVGVIAVVSAGASILSARLHSVRGPGAGLLCVPLLAILAGLTWSHAGAFRDSETLWLDTLAKNPECWMAHHNLGLDLVERGQFEPAVEHYRCALRLYPDAEAHLALGAALGALGKTDEAAAAYQAAIRLNPDYAEAYSNLSNLLARQGDGQQAFQYAAKALRLKPDSAQAHFNLANALNLLGKPEAAVSEYKAAINLRPDYAEAHYNLSGVLLVLGRTDEAARHISEAVRLQPDRANVRVKLAIVLTRQGQTAEAIRQYREALRQEPESVEALRNLAWLLATHHDAQYRDGPAAVGLAEKAVRLTQEQDAGAYDALAAAYAESGDFSRALSAVERALVLAAAAPPAVRREHIQARQALYRAGRPWRE